MKRAKPEAETRLPWWKQDLPTLAMAVGAALLIRTFVFQTFYVPSPSMLPTLLIGDHVFVNKFVYGPKVPGIDRRLPGLRLPERGEVIVFRFARDPQRGTIHPVDQYPELPTDNFVKRLVGLPGDRVEVRDDRLILNGEVAPLEDTGKTYVASNGQEFRVLIETLGECRHVVLDDQSRPGFPMSERTIAPGRYLFMGDNRDNSQDGRMVGTVRLEELAGPAGLNYWSWDWEGSWFALLNPFTWIDNLVNHMRWGRMGSFVRCLESGEEPRLEP
jgi:signal peptidase I